MIEKHRIMTFVGNGFDISVLMSCGTKVTTSYSSFYEFYVKKYPDNENLLIRQMREAREEGKENWSDFEALLGTEISNIDITDKNTIDNLYKDLLHIQQEFSRFLNKVVNNEIIDYISKKTIACDESQKSFGHISITEFIGDLSEEQYKRCKVDNKVDNHDRLFFTFINFNYTALLDNYLYLDKEIFDPQPYTSSDNNFTMNTNPNNYEGHKTFNNPYCKLISQVFHPHGYQNVPKSMLFGTEVDLNRSDKNDFKRKFVKSVWARNEDLYGDYFLDTKLFVIYGCFLGAKR